jgi:hypothetical protein
MGDSRGDVQPGVDRLSYPLEDPPRAIPTGLLLTVLAHRDVTGSLYYLLPAAAALTGAMAIPGALRHIILLLELVGAMLLMLGLRSALPALFRSRATLSRMRSGFVTLGRIVSCHLAWDSKRKEMPYREFLEDWAAKVAKSQMGKALGCFMTMFVMLFVAPFVLMALLLGLVLAARALGVLAGEPVAADLDAAYLGTWFAAGLATTAAFLAFALFWRRGVEKAVVPYMEWRRLAKPGDRDVYDEHAMRLVELAKERGEQISLKAPLPADNSGVELICKVEYSVMGEPCVATARARLSDRLNAAGVERLIFDPVKREQVDLFAGLPEEARIDASGRWGDVSAGGSVAWLALTAAAAAVSIAALLGNVPRLYALVGPTP